MDLVTIIYDSDLLFYIFQKKKKNIKDIIAFLYSCFFKKFLIEKRKEKKKKKKRKTEKKRSKRKE